jgi:DNA-binding NarL/FixJ family response regulator
MGFPNPTVTSKDKDGLNMLIYDLKPDLIMMGASFYQCSTPYMMGELKKTFPNIPIAALSIGDYPADLAMYFILNGAMSYFNFFESIENFYKGLEYIKRGKTYISPYVIERIEMRKEYPLPARVLSKLLIEVVRCICNGFNKTEIADNLAISERTVENHRKEIYRSLNVRGGEALIKTALQIGFVTQDELAFYHPNYCCAPLPDKKRKKWDRG